MRTLLTIRGAVDSAFDSELSFQNCSVTRSLRFRLPSVGCWALMEVYISWKQIDINPVVCSISRGPQMTNCVQYLAKSGQRGQRWHCVAHISSPMHWKSFYLHDRVCRWRCTTKDGSCDHAAVQMWSQARKQKKCSCEESGDVPTTPHFPGDCCNWTLFNRSTTHMQPLIMIYHNGQ